MSTIDTRLPKSGIRRRWMLMGEGSKAVAIAALCFVAYMAFTFLFAPAKTNEVPLVTHSLSSEEKEELRKRIHEEEYAKFLENLDLYKGAYYAHSQELLESIEELQGIGGEEDKENEEKVAKLEAELEKLKKQMEDVVEQKTKDFEEGIEGIISTKLAAMQQSLIEEGANELLQWFCEYESASGEAFPDALDAEASFADVARYPVELEDQQCVGVATEEDRAIHPKLYSSRAPGVVRRVAQQAMAALRSENPQLVGADLHLESLAADTGASHNNLLFAVHPVFGTFYKVRLPLVDKRIADGAGAAAAPAKKGDDDDDDKEEEAGNAPYTRTVCFRRRWITKPVVAPLSTLSNVEHLFKPELLRTDNVQDADPTKADPTKLDKLEKKGEALLNGGKRRLEGKAGDEDKLAGLASDVVGTHSKVHFILPFRARNIDALPNLLRSFDDANYLHPYLVQKQQKDGAEDPLKAAKEAAAEGHAHDVVKLLIVPVEEEYELLADIDAMKRVNEAVKAASEVVSYEISVVAAIPRDHMTKPKIKAITREWVERSLKNKAKAKESLPKADVGVDKKKAAIDIAVAGAKGKEAGLADKAAPAATTANTAYDKDAFPVLPSDWLAAVLGGLMHVPYGRSIVFVLDSATISVSASLAKKALWRVVEGKQVYSPIMFSIASSEDGDDDIGQAALNDGGITMSPAEVEAVLQGMGKEAKMPYADPQFYVQIMEDDPTPTSTDDRRQLRGVGEGAEEAAPAGGAGGRRLLGLDDFSDDTYGRLVDTTSVSWMRDDWYSGDDAAAASGAGADSMGDDDLWFRPDYYSTGYQKYAGGQYLYDDAYSDDFYGDKSYSAKWASKYGYGYKSGDDDIMYDDAFRFQPALWAAGEDDYEYELPEAQGQYDRATAIGTTKVDLAGAIYQMISGWAPPPKEGGKRRLEGDEEKKEEGEKEDKKEAVVKPEKVADKEEAKVEEKKAETPAPPAKVEEAEPERPQVGDQCLMLRILKVLADKRYRIVRHLRAGLRVRPQDGGAWATGEAPEMGPCECNEVGATQGYCQLRLSVASTDDLNDKFRVNCAITQMAAAAKARAAAKAKKEKKEVSVEGDTMNVNIDDVVHVDHPVRYFDPSRGLEIVAKVAPSNNYESGIEEGRPVKAEVFSFRWYLTAAAVEYTTEMAG